MKITLKHLFEFSKRHQVWMAFVLLLAVMLWLNLRQTNFIFYGDSLFFWRLKNTFEVKHHFSLTNYHNPLWGYLFPLMGYVISKTSGFLSLPGIQFLVVVQTIVFCGVITFIVPGTVEKLFNRKPDFTQIMVFAFFVVYFWRGYFFYPLSDFWAIFFLIFGIYFIADAGLHWWKAIFVGIFWGGMVIIRPIYQILIILLPMWGVLYLLKTGAGRKKILFQMLCVIIGMTIALTPQLVINIANFGVYNPFVLERSGSRNPLFQKMGRGIELQKYETNVGANYPRSDVLFFDRNGESILFRSGYKSIPYAITKPQIGINKIMTLQGYLHLIATYPFDFLLIFFRHLFNGLDVVYNTPYVHNIYQPSLHFRLVNYSLWYIVLFWVYKRLRVIGASVLSRDFLLAVILILPGLLSIPVAMEVRFMLPIHLIAYSLAAFFILPNMLSLPKIAMESLLSKPFGWYLIFLLLCFLLSENTFMGLEYGSYLFR